MSGTTHQRPVAAQRAIGLVFWASGIDMGVWASQIPRVKDWLALTDSGLATVVLSFAIGAILTMPLTGAIVTRLGGPRTVVAAGVAGGLALILLGLSDSYWSLLCTTLLTGVAVGGLDVAMNTQATAIERAWGAPIMSGIHGWFSLGGLVGAAAGGALTEASASFRTVLFVAGAADLIAVAIAGRWLRVAEQTSGGRGFAWPRRAVLSIGSLCLLAFLVEGAVFDWTAVYMHDVGGASLGLASAGFGGFSLTMAATRFAGDAFTRRFGATRVLAGGASLAAAGIGLACAVPHPLVVTAGLCLAGFGQANVVPLLFSAASRVPNMLSAQSIAMAATMGYGAFVVGPPAIGFIADAVGLRLALLVLVGCLLAVAASARVAQPAPVRGRP